MTKTFIPRREENSGFRLILHILTYAIRKYLTELGARRESLQSFFDTLPQTVKAKDRSIAFKYFLRLLTWQDGSDKEEPMRAELSEVPTART
jgi:hypothetical protein